MGYNALIRNGPDFLKCGADISEEQAEQSFDVGSGTITCPHCGEEIGE